MSNRARKRPERRTRVENLEARQVMSADPLGGLLGGGVSHHVIEESFENHAVDESKLVQHAAPALGNHGQRDPDFSIDRSEWKSLDEHVQEIEQTLSSAHQFTGLDQVRADYGFTGAGQTVAVIDSGIAYDHYALGGGFGENYRVVGGWDFTENDADPYDDGPEGSHGSHVAGIVGADDGGRSGVATGVDLVGLRVFSDSGAGYFTWVEQALSWVHENRNAFENPITAVNLSLGTAWNDDTVPGWANLEEEFAQLAADGIFVSVSAGNDFTSYNEPGLSYPAASPYVVPVMALDDDGSLSYFSQRHERAIAAPGRFIYSTVPDYAGDHDGVTDDWANFSGTSMAAPYVAGASVIIREAMELVGYTGITQDTIYDHIMDTADSFYDSATEAWYSRLNMEAAIDALMPADDYGSTVETAHSLGVIGADGDQSVSGMISTLDDTDFFTFTAEANGTVTFTADNATHGLAAQWQSDAGGGETSPDGNSFTINVAAGQQYAIGLSTSDGLGYYDLTVSADTSFSFVDWGATGRQQTHEAVTVDGESYYRVEAGQAGYVTVETLHETGTVTLDLLDAGLNVVSAGVAGRADYYAAAGEELYVRVDGSAADVDFRVTNAVSVSGSEVTLVGTGGDDAVEFTAGAQHLVSLNGVEYLFSSSEHDFFVIDGGAGGDAIVMTGGAGDETATLRVGEAMLAGDAVTASAGSVEDVVVHGGGGYDTARFYDSAGDDEFRTSPEYALMRGENFTNMAWGFDWSVAFATAGGYDIARFHDSSGSDEFETRPERAVMQGSGFTNVAWGFDWSVAFATGGGYDVARFYDSSGSDEFETHPDRAVMQGSGFTNVAWGFDWSVAFATAGGYDVARFHDSAGDDRLKLYPDYAVMQGDGFTDVARGFDWSVAFASAGGYDVARFFDSSGGDEFDMYPDYAVMQGAGFTNVARGFDWSVAFATSGGYDVATFYDSSGNDEFRAYPEYSVMRGPGFTNVARGFNEVASYANAGGFDQATLEDSEGDDDLLAENWGSELSGQDFTNRASGFDEITAYLVNGGSNSADVNVTDYVFELIGA